MKILKIIVLLIISITIFLNIDYDIRIYKIIESVKEKIKFYIENSRKEYDGESIKMTYPKEIKTPICSKNECILKNGTKVKLINLGEEKIYMTKTITPKEYVPADNTLCTEMGWCDKNDDWWQGAKDYCESIGMSLPTIQVLENINNKNLLALKYDKSYWTALRVNQYVSAYEYSLKANKAFIASRRNENNVMCVLILKDNK